MKKTILGIVLLAWAIDAVSQTVNIPQEEGMFENNWESLKQWECPEWFKASMKRIQGNTMSQVSNCQQTKNSRI